MDGNWGEWSEFQELYDAGKLDEALRALQAHPKETAAYFHNLGTLSFRQGQFGLATAYLEKAARMEPRNPAISGNLELARGKLAALIGESRLDPAASWADQLSSSLPVAPLLGAVSLAALAGLAGVAARFRKSRSVRGAWISRPGALGASMALCALFLSSLQAGVWGGPAAACLDSQVVRSGPGDRFIELGRVEPGTKVRITGESIPDEQNPKQLWRQVRFSGSGIGWLKSSSLLLL